jgi:nuclear polyadenylated RNA-binding protein 3
MYEVGAVLIMVEDLEFSRTQKKGGGDRERDRSPDRSRRGKDGGRGADRYDGRDQGGRRSRDDYRPDRSPDPTKRESGGYGGRNPYDFSDRQRNRSRSPRGHGRQESDQYRRRSPSPYRRSQADQAADRLDIPRRYGSDVPDVQLLLLQEVQREFVSWVQKAFYDRGLKSDVMFLNPRFPRDAVIQRQVLEGVHGVIELDARAQGTGTISLQVFDRSAGASNVRFDQYQALDPKVAAELVLRAKQQASPSQPAPSSGYQPPNYGAAYQPPLQQQQYSYPPVAPQQQQAPPAQPDLSALMSQLDPASLQRLLASLQGGQSSAQPNLAGLLPQQAPPRQNLPPPNQAAPAPNSQIDVNAILASLKGPSAPQAPPTQQARPPAGYGAPAPAPAYGAPQPGLPAGATAEQQQQVENIMATLAKFRQR